MPAGSTASANCVVAARWGVTVRSAISNTPVQQNIAGWMFRRVAPLGTFSSTDFVTQSESARNSGTSAGKPKEPPSKLIATRAVVPALLADFQVRGLHAHRDGQGRDLRGDFHVGVHVVELTPGIAILDAQPGLAVFRDDLEFLVLRNIESLGPLRIDAGVLETPLGKQVHLGRGASSQDDKKRENQRKLDVHVRFHFRFAGVNTSCHGRRPLGPQPDNTESCSRLGPCQAPRGGGTRLQSVLATNGQADG